MTQDVMLGEDEVHRPPIVAFIAKVYLLLILILVKPQGPQHCLRVYVHCLCDIVSNITCSPCSE